MDKVRVAVLGLGNFGHSWATEIVPACAECAELAAVIEKDREKWQGIPEGVPKYESLEEALREAQPELVINVTPPHLHTSLNEGMLRQGYAVLCEKPIAQDKESALEMQRIHEETGGFLMIGENYRYHDIIRRARQALEAEDLGAIHQVSCKFRHYHPDYSMFYHGHLKHPLLEDVTVHHLDLARFLSGEEPEKVWCKEYGAPYCWYQQRPATVNILTEMTNGVVFHYEGTLASPVSTTDWNGDWEIECDKGAVRVSGSSIRVYKEGEQREILLENPTPDSRTTMLREACAALREGRKASTDFSDNLRSFLWMRAALESSENGTWVNCEEREEK